MTLLQRMLHAVLAAPAGAAGGGGEAQVLPRSRAVAADDKEARRHAILDAAARLFSRKGELSHVADIAQEAGLAKGTVYLYFPTKEAVYLALHLREIESFFEDLQARLTGPEPFGIEDMGELTQRYFLRNRHYMPLCAFCMGFAPDAVPEAVWQHFHERLGMHLMSCGVGIERRWPHLPAGEGVRLLKHSYAMMIGLYHLLGEHPGQELALPRPSLPGLGSYEDEALLALFRYWRAVIAEPAPAKFPSSV